LSEAQKMKKRKLSKAAKPREVIVIEDDEHDIFDFFGHEVADIPSSWKVKQTNSFSEKMCDLCNFKIEQGDVVVLTECNHVFHLNGLKDWFLIDPFQLCPICKYSLLK